MIWLIAACQRDLQDVPLRFPLGRNIARLRVRATPGVYIFHFGLLSHFGFHQDEPYVLLSLSRIYNCVRS